MKKGMHYLLSVGLLFSMTTVQTAPHKHISKISKKHLALITGFIATTIVYYKKFAANPRFSSELPKDATQLERLIHYLYYEVLGYTHKEEFTKTRNGTYRKSRTRAKGLGWLYSECADFAKLLSIPGAILGLEKFINTLLAKEV